MLELSSKRLRIVCLDLENFRLYIHQHGKMQRNIGVQVVAEELDEGLKKVFTPVYEQALNDSQNYAWYTVWQIILKSENRIIGGICFKGKPNINGEVEFGYGIDLEYQNKGYMTEAVMAIIQWAITQNRVSFILAATEKSNPASQKVLEKSGMAVYKETDSCLWWRSK